MKKNIFLGALLLASPLVFAEYFKDKVLADAFLAGCSSRMESTIGADMANILKSGLQECTTKAKRLGLDCNFCKQSKSLMLFTNVIVSNENFEKFIEAENNTEAEQAESSDEGMAAATESENDSVATVEPSEDGMTEEATSTETEDAQ